MDIVVRLKTNAEGTVVAAEATADGRAVSVGDIERWRLQDLAHQISQLEPVEREG